MNPFEKIYSIFAIISGTGLVTALLLFPGLRELNVLLSLCSVGFIINIGLMFVVLRDIFLRTFNTQTKKFFWLLLVLLFWPAIIYYLPKYGFRSRTIVAV